MAGNNITYRRFIRIPSVHNSGSTVNIQRILPYIKWQAGDRGNHFFFSLSDSVTDAPFLSRNMVQEIMPSWRSTDRSVGY